MGISSKSLVAKLYWQLVVACLLALLVHEPSQKLANGQLEAVGAVLSVVPVTSILATAGLVGVKLAALSRLLNILGYDRAYLAQNLGTGTAAAPIGLQTRYAYMFPYVPGLNISVKGDDSIGMPKEAVTELAEDGTKAGGNGGGGAGGVPAAGGLPPRRKTYPAMSLPGDYEHQLKPFRGSEALKGIFNKAGLQVHIPTAEQQQQMQQQFNLPAQDQPPITTNDHQQQQQPHEPAGSLISNQSGNSVAPSNSNVAPNRPMESSSSSQSGASIGAPSGGDQPASKPSSSNSHQPNQQPTSSSNSNNNSQSPTGTGQAAAAVGTATQQHHNQQQQHHLRHFQIQF